MIPSSHTDREHTAHIAASSILHPITFFGCQARYEEVRFAPYKTFNAPKSVMGRGKGRQKKEEEEEGRKHLKKNPRVDKEQKTQYNKFKTF